MLFLITRSLALAAAVAAASHSSAQATTLYVPQAYLSIQSAVDSAPPGAIIVVAPGTYRENLQIGKPLTLRSAAGAKQTIIDGGSVGPVVQVRGTGRERVTIDGFTITNGLSNFWLPAGMGTGDAAGIHLQSVIGVVSHNVIQGNVGCLGLGVSAVTASVAIEANLISDNRQDPLCGGADGGGVFLRGDGVAPSVLAGNIISGHRIAGRGAGIALQGVSSVTVRDNLISNNESIETAGGLLLNTSSATIINNVFINNASDTGGGLGLYPIDEANPVVLSGNVLIGNRATVSGSGIYLSAWTEPSAKISGNVIQGSTPNELVYCSGAFTVSMSNVLRNTEGSNMGGGCMRGR